MCLRNGPVCQEEEIEELVAVIRRFRSPDRIARSTVAKPNPGKKVFADKKFVDGKIRFVVTPRLGGAVAGREHHG